MNDTEKILTRGVAEVILKDHLEQILSSGKKLRVKLGIDPTAPDIHLGHTVPLRKLRQFQEAGHKIVLIIGDFTAMIGDPAGRADARKPLTEKDVKANLKNYLQQAGKVIDVKKSEIHYNGEWYKKTPNLILDLMRRESLQRVIERDDFQKRIKAGQEITFIESIYPLLQGYDSVAVRADVEVGGTDQKFNLLMGRKIQRSFGLPEQDILTLPIIEGLDGVKKMSKSYGNYIGVSDRPNDMFGKIMGVPDGLIDKYYTLLTEVDRTISDPREAKLELGRIIVSMYHGNQAGTKAKEEFINVFSKKGLPSDRPRHKEAGGMNVIDGLLKTGAASSKSEARRLVQQGGVSFGDKKVTDLNAVIPEGTIVKVGKHRYFDT